MGLWDWLLNSNSMDVERYKFRLEDEDRLTRAVLFALGFADGLSSLSASILLSHVSHGLSVVQLWYLTDAITGHQNSAVPLTTAALHIISPAGVFLSAPYSESLFSFLSMSGFLGYVYAVRHFDRGQVVTGSTAMVCAGLCFGTATIVRSNGVLSGIPFLIEAITSCMTILSQGISATRLTRFGSAVAGGLWVGFGMLFPQALAYQEYCHGRSTGNRRPWCNVTIPSIFTWVQSHYW